MKNSKYEEQKKKKKSVSKIPSSRVILQANDGVEVGTASGPRTAVHFLFCAEQKKKKTSSSTQLLG